MPLEGVSFAERPRGEREEGDDGYLVRERPIFQSVHFPLGLGLKVVLESPVPRRPTLTNAFFFIFLSEPCCSVSSITDSVKCYESCRHRKVSQIETKFTKSLTQLPDIKNMHGFMLLRQMLLES